MKQSTVIASVIALITLLALNDQPAQGQVFDQLLRNFRSTPDGGETSTPGVRTYDRPNSMGVNIPMFYDMTRNGNSLGINVLSGMVRVQRGEEASRSGLSGPNPLSVRIFGIPVYERGTRTSWPEGSSYQPEYQTPSNIVPPPMPVPEGPDGPIDPSG